MTFRTLNKKYIEPIAQWVMIFGIIALCQPWIQWLHEWSVAITLVGLVTFLVSIHVPPPDPEAHDEDDTGPVSISDAVKGHDHG
jgi:hypothetical protein